MPQGEPSGRSESFLAQLRNEGVRIGGEDETLVRAVLDRLHAVGECQRVRAARDAAQVLASLRLDADSMVAALFLGMDADEPTVSAVTGARAARIWVLMDGARRMQDLHALLPEAQVTGRSAIRTTQVERLRKMVLAMAQDGRVVVVHLAFHLVRLRQLVKEGAVHERLEAARETFELRVLLEAELTARALDRMDAATLAELRESQRMIAALGGGSGGRQASRTENYRFHFRLYELAERPQTLQFVRVLWARYPFVSQERGGARLKNIEEHERFLRLVEAGDRPGSVQAMVAHIQSGWNDLLASEVGAALG
jgi:DNA-binding FadR family transcriptional regulator